MLNDRQHARSPVACGAMFLGLATAVLALAGCAQPGAGGATADDLEVQPSELSDAGGLPCPENLPIGEDPSGHGFGIAEAARELPTMLEPQEAWVCKYEPFDVGTTASGGAMLGWKRAEQPELVPGGDLPGLHGAVRDLALFDRDRACNSDLGPRWMVVYNHDGDLTGMVVDDYGCREVRLTDNPHTTPPGAGDQDGAVSGVLDGGAAILDALGVGRPS